MPKKLHILNVVGARPNFIKIAPLFREYARHPDRIKATLVHTGQHYDDAMSQVFFEDLQLPEPHIYLGVGSGSHAVQTGKIMSAFEEVLLNDRPDLVLVVGDVNSTMACTLVAAKLTIPVAHVEAGLRSFDRTMPEEINRLVTDRLADFLFTTCADADENLHREGISGQKIFRVGNTMIDSLFAVRHRFEASTMKQQLGLNGTVFGFVTLHRPSNVDDKQVFVRIGDALGEIQKHTKLLWPVHPRTRKMLETHGLTDKFQSMHNVVTTEPLSYIDSMALMAAASFVLTDSGGIQEETTVLGIPCLTLRETTERPITITEGTNTLVGTDPSAIVEQTLKILQGKGKRGKVPPLWDGKAAERIVQALLHTMKV